MARMTASFEREPNRSVLSKEEQQGILAALENTLELDDRSAFVEACFKAIEPMLELRRQNPLRWEDYQAQETMKMPGHFALNRRIYYTLEQGCLQLHLADAYERKDEVESFYKDALQKIVEIVRLDPTIIKIGGWSWLNATKTYGSMKERLGFTLSDLTEDQQKMYNDTPQGREGRKVKNALMTREEFLKRYG